MKIHYFQRYHTKENVATANTMLLLNRLYSNSIENFYQFLQKLFFDGSHDDKFDLSPVIELQKKMKHSTPDAFISQPSFTIVFETKLDSNNFSIKQLLRHLKNFSDKQYANEQHKVLVTIAPQKMRPGTAAEFQLQLDEYNKSQNQPPPVLHVNTTFEDLVEAIQEVIPEQDSEIQEILDDYREYCYADALFKPDTAWKLLRVRVAEHSWEICKHFNLYYDAAEYGFREHEYFGLYCKKSVCAIGKIEAIIKASKKNGKLFVKRVDTKGKTDGEDGAGKVSNEHRKRVEEAMEEAKNFGHDLSNKEHYYFLVEKFYDTDFKKSTPYGLRKVKYFDLVKELEWPENHPLPPLEEIAERLRSKTWE